MTNIILVGLGIILIIFSFPKMRRPFMNRVFNEGYVTPKQYKPETTEIIANTGPSTTLFAIGVILIIIGIII